MKNIGIVYVLTLLSFLMLGISFLMMPFAHNAESERKILLVFTGMIFWLSLIMGVILMIRLKTLNHKLNIRDKVRCNHSWLHTNITGIIAIVIFCTGTMTISTLVTMGRVNSYLIYVSISAIVVSIALYLLSEKSLYRRIRSKERKRGRSNEG